MTYPDQARKPSWTDDDNWTEDKTDEQFLYLLSETNRRNLIQREKDWLQLIVPGVVIVDEF